VATLDDATFIKSLRAPVKIPSVSVSIHRVGAIRVAASGKRNGDTACVVSRGVGGGLVSSSGSYSNTSWILSSVGENGDRGLPK
jgi:hypothetical protein